MKWAHLDHSLAHSTTHLHIFDTCPCPYVSNDFNSDRILSDWHLYSVFKWIETYIAEQVDPIDKMIAPFNLWKNRYIFHNINCVYCRNLFLFFTYLGRFFTNKFLTRNDTSSRRAIEGRNKPTFLICAWFGIMLREPWCLSQKLIILCKWQKSKYKE